MNSKLPMLDGEDLTYQHLIAKHFGYKDDFIDKYYTAKCISASGKKNKNVKVLHDNTSHTCAYCGQIFKDGFYGKEALSKTISGSYNECYSFSLKPKNEAFVCAPCAYNIQNYKTKKILNVAIFKDRVKRIESIKSDNTNSFYEYIVNKPKEDFILIINSRGKVLEIMSHLAVPTVAGSDIITLIRGMKVYYVNRLKVVECMNDTIDMIKKYKDIDKNFILNFYSDNKYYEGKNSKFLRERIIIQEGLINDLQQIYIKYSKDTKWIATILFEKHKKVLRDRKKGM